MNFPKSMIPRAGSINSPAVVELCKKLVEIPEPLYLDVKPVDAAVIGDCILNVENHIVAKGGSIQYGWQIWQMERMVEAEFHAVWVDAQGNFQDITPKGLFNISTILFLPDSATNYIGRQIDNVRMPVDENDELIKKFIDVNERFFEVCNRGELADQYGEIVATPEMQEIMAERDKISWELMIEDNKSQPKMTLARPSKNAPCSCGSGKKYKRCCGG